MNVGPYAIQTQSTQIISFATLLLETGKLKSDDSKMKSKLELNPVCLPDVSRVEQINRTMQSSILQRKQEKYTVNDCLNTQA